MARSTVRRKRRLIVALADAPLCVEEQYYHDLALPLLRQGGSRRARTLTAQVGPLLALTCALFVVVSLLLITPARSRQTTLLAPLQARFAAAPPALAIALIVALPLFVALAAVSLWARLDLAREHRILATLEAKLRLARAYRRYLTGLIALTEPLAWLKQQTPSAASAAGASLPAVVVALPVSRDARWDEPPSLSPPDDENGSGDLSRSRARFGWDANVEAARRKQRQAQTVEGVTQALARAESGAILLSGGEGAGKTTLMRFVAHAQAQAQLQRARPGGRIPFYADLGWLARGWPAQRGGETVAAALAELTQRIGGLEAADAQALAHALTHESALLLFDELDTLPAEERERAASSLGAFLATRNRQRVTRENAGEGWVTQVALAARSYEAPLGDGPVTTRLQRWMIEPLTYPMGRLAVARGALAQWRGAAPEAVESEAEATLRTLAAPQTETWLMQPLPLTLAAIAGEQTPDSAPYRSRTDLFMAATEALICARVPAWSAGERQALRRVAEELALWAHVRGRRSFSPAAPELDADLSHQPHAQLVAQRAGLTSPSQVVAESSGLCERGPDGAYSFSVVSLQAFLAGCALARRAAGEAPTPLVSDAPATDTPTLALAWARRATERWRETLVFMGGALCSPTVARGEAPRPDIARAWLRSLLTQGDALAAPGLLLAAATLPELRGDPAGASIAAEIATHLYQALSSNGHATTSTAHAEVHRACVMALADPVGRRTLLDLLRDQLLGDDAHAAQQAAHTFGALGQAGAQVAPLLIELLHSTIWTPRAAVARAIGALGPAFGAEVIPALLSALDDQTLTVRIAVIEALGAVVSEPDAVMSRALLTRLSDREGSVRAAAAAALGALGARTDEEAEALTLALNDAETRVQVAAAFALGSAGAAAGQMPALIEALSAIGWSHRAAAALALGEIGPAAAPAIPALLELSRDEIALARSAATRALGRLAPQRADVIAAVLERLSDAASEPRRAAAEALAQAHDMSPEMQARARATLLDALHDPREGVRLAASRTLSALGATSDPTSQTTLYALLDDPRGYVRAAAAHTLASLGDAAINALPRRIVELPSVREEACLVAIEELGMFGATARAAAPTLARLLADPRWEIRRAALRALKRIEPPQVVARRSIARVNDPEALVRLEAIEALGAHDRRYDRWALEALQRRLIEDPTGEARAAAARALGRMGPRAASMLPLLLRALGDSDGETQQAAALAIGALHLPPAKLIPQLTGRLSDPAPGVRGAIALALGALGPDAAQTVTPELLILLRDADPITRAAAATALGNLGPAAGAAAREALLPHLDDTDGETRAAAALALGRLGAGADTMDTLMELTGALLTRTYDTRFVARCGSIEALVALGPAVTRTALPRLMQMQTDFEESTREAARAALTTLDAEGQAEALPMLTALLVAESAEQRTAGALALAAMRPTLAAPDRDTLTALLTDADDATRAAAARCVGALAKTTFHGEPPMALSALLGDQTWEARAAAAAALGAFGARVNATDRSALRATLADPDETTRQAATRALMQVDAHSAQALMLELVNILKTRQPLKTLAPLAERRELEIYAAMEQPSWPVVMRVTSWLGADTHWATQREAITLLKRWRYAPIAARRRLLTLSEYATSPAIRAAAAAALSVALAQAPDLDQTTRDDAGDAHDAATWATLMLRDTNHAARDVPAALRITADAPAAPGAIAIPLSSDEGKSA